MRLSLALGLALLGCGPSGDDALQRGIGMRRELLVDMNKTVRDAIGTDVFRLDGKYDEVLVYTKTPCNPVLLLEFLKPKTVVRLSLEIGDFRGLRCEDGITITPPWTDK
jgi:hypothetical protein